jgi:hypothetical protein
MQTEGSELNVELEEADPLKSLQLLQQESLQPRHPPILLVTTFHIRVRVLPDLDGRDMIIQTRKLTGMTNLKWSVAN